MTLHLETTLTAEGAQWIQTVGEGDWLQQNLDRLLAGNTFPNRQALYRYLIERLIEELESSAAFKRRVQRLLTRARILLTTEQVIRILSLYLKGLI